MHHNLRALQHGREFHAADHIVIRLGAEGILRAVSHRGVGLGDDDAAILGAGQHITGQGMALGIRQGQDVIIGVDTIEGIIDAVKTGFSDHPGGFHVAKQVADRAVIG